MRTQELRFRLAAILAADAVSYARLMSVDERGTVEALDNARKTFQSISAANGGRIVDTAGDSVLAIFETAAGATAAALAIQHELETRASAIPEGRRLRFRIGLNLGDVVQKSDGSVYGDGVNVAARLQSAAMAGGIVASESIRLAVRGKVAARFEDMGDHSLKNIAEAVRAHGVSAAGLGSHPLLGAAQESQPVRSASTGPNWRQWLLGRLAKVILAAIGITVVGVGGYLSIHKSPANSSDSAAAAAGPLSIVVLPFANLTGDPSQAYVADGLTASITADLSRIRDAFVVGVSSALAYKDKALTAQQIGKELGVRFVLQGNVQRSGGKVRINAQLSDTASNAQLWSESFDGDSGDLFRLQDQVTTLIGNSMGRELVVRAARESERRPNGATVADLLLRAHALGIKPQSFTTLKDQEALTRKALELEPGNFDAMSYLSWSLTNQALNFGEKLGPQSKENAIAEAADICARMQAVDPEDYRLTTTLGSIALLKGDFDGSLRAWEKALTLAPKAPGAYINLASLLYRRAQPERALALLQQAMALDPKSPRDLLLSNMARVNFMLGDYDSAIAWSLRFRENNATFLVSDPTLAVAYAMKGDRKRALAAMEASIKAEPTNTISSMAGGIEDPANHIHPAFRTWFRQVYVPALRLAGFPE